MYDLWKEKVEVISMVEGEYKTYGDVVSPSDPNVVQTEDGNILLYKPASTSRVMWVGIVAPILVLIELVASELGWIPNTANFWVILGAAVAAIVGVFSATNNPNFSGDKKKISLDDPLDPDCK